MSTRVQSPHVLALADGYALWAWDAVVAVASVVVYSAGPV